MLIRRKKYDLEKLNKPRELTRNAKLYFKGGKVKPRESLTMQRHKQRMYKKKFEEERMRQEREHHLNPSKRERMQAQQNLFGLKRRVVDRLLQKKAGNGLGKKRQDTRVLLQAYKEIDADKDGGVSYDEFERAVGPNHLDIGLTDEEVHQLCIACDIDGNGDITFDEFLQTLIFADKPETQLMLDRARKRESKFLKDTVNSPINIKPLNTFGFTSPLADTKSRQVRTSSSLKDVHSLLGNNKSSSSGSSGSTDALLKIGNTSGSRLSGPSNLSIDTNSISKNINPRPMTTSPVRTGSNSPLKPIPTRFNGNDNSGRNISTAGAVNTFRSSRSLNNKSPLLESYATMSRQRERHLDPGLNFKSKSGRFDSLFYIDPNSLDGKRNGRDESNTLTRPNVNLHNNRPMTTLSSSHANRHNDGDMHERPTTTTAYASRNNNGRNNERQLYPIESGR
eukprot:g13141.t1